MNAMPVQTTPPEPGQATPWTRSGETAGAPAIDPQILLALWVYATSEGVSSGREIG
jgi:hypothetical protein